MSLLGFNPVDLTIFALVVTAMIVGFTQGLLRQMIGLAVLYIAAILGAQYYPTLSSWMAAWARLASTTRLINALAFLIIVFFVVALLNVLAYDAYRSTKIKIFPLVDHLGGTILGLASLIIAITLILPVLDFAVFESWPPGYESMRIQLRDWLRDARLISYFNLIKPMIRDALGPWLPAGIPAIFDFK